MAGPIEVLKANRAELVGAAQSIGRKRLTQLLAKAQTDLNARIRKADAGPGKESFTAHQLKVTLIQVEHVIQQLNAGLKALALDNAKALADPAVEGVLEYLRAADKKFAGITERLPIRDAILFERAKSGAESSVLHRLEGDSKRGPGILDRYGDAVVQQFEDRMQQRLIARTPWEDVRNGLIADSPFLQQAPAHWAERIVRTEAMNGSNRAIWEANKEADQQLGDIVKFLSATFDNRTAADSYAVHGQCRRPSEAFDTWQGAIQHPPARPNDREIVVTHRMSWPIPPELKPRSASEVASRWIAEGRTGAHPPIPKITTVPFSEFGKAPPPVQQAPTKAPIEEPPAIPTKPARGPIASPFFDENVQPFVSKPRAPVDVMVKRVGEQKGSNEGGFYRGSDDVLRYVKFYKDPTQGVLEHLANNIYKDLGLPAVKSDLITAPDGRQAYSSEVLEGDTLAKKGITKPAAKQVMKGFAADVLVKNWDAVGLEHDNIILGPGGKAVRIDNGGAFLHRAKAGLKPEESLHKLDEWEQFFNPNKNAAYAKVAQAAGVTKAEDIVGIKQQIKAIQALRDAHGGWGNYIDKAAPGLPSETRNKVAAMLAERTSQLGVKLRELSKRKTKPKPGDQEFHQLPRKALDPYVPKPRGWTESNDVYAKKVERKINAWKSEHSEGYDAMRSYTAGDYRSIRDTQWLSEEEWFIKHAGGVTTSDVYRAKYNFHKKKYAELTKGFDQAPAGGRGSAHEESLTDLYRGIHSISDAKIRELSNAKEYPIDAITSTTWKVDTAKQFGYEKDEPDKNAVIFHYKLKPTSSHKLAVENKSSNPGEGEVLFKHGLKFKVVDAHQMEGRKRTLLLTLEEI